MRTILEAGAMLLAAAACSAAQRPTPATGTPVLTIRGEVENAPFEYGERDLGSLPHRSFRAKDPHLSREIVFEGVDLAQLLAEKLTVKKGADTVVIHCLDKYDVAIPLSAIRRHKPVLAVKLDEKARPDWERWGTTELGPLYLVWPNLDDPGLDTDPKVNPWWWAFQATAVELVVWERTFARALRVPPGASDGARLGSELFQQQCIHCHKLRGVGGAKGPDLGEVAKAEDRSRFIAYVKDPAKIVPQPQMPGFAALGDKGIGDLHEFVRAVVESSASAEPPQAGPWGDEHREPERRRGGRP